MFNSSFFRSVAKKCSDALSSASDTSHDDETTPLLLGEKEQQHVDDLEKQAEQAEQAKQPEKEKHIVTRKEATMQNCSTDVSIRRLPHLFWLPEPPHPVPEVQPTRDPVDDVRVWREKRLIAQAVSEAIKAQAEVRKVEAEARMAEVAAEARRNRSASS
ncbi:hypothetical protein KEM56_001677 [Ascosphaera pollenicola]|nr:hypothetical protein KEM56_001677 [Ascosphaera pollenicola]